MSIATDEEVLRTFDEMEHKDLVHQVVFDAYGRRMASCSSDMHVCVWDREDSGKWIKTSSWKIHGGPVWRVAWAHPEFGQVLATASNDRSVFVWEETMGSGPTKWTKKASFSDNRVTVTDIKFAPNFLGLQLATTNAAGIVLVYEAPDITDLSQWSLLHEMSPFYYRCSSLSWSCAQGLRPLMVVGCDDPEAKDHERLAVYELNDNVRKWTSLPTVKISEVRPVNDVGFSPAVSMLGHVMAVACGDVNLYNLTMRATRSNNAANPTSYFVQKISVLSDGYKTWRLSWNVTGNAVTLCTAEGAVRVWKSMYMDEWKLVSTTIPSERREIKKKRAKEIKPSHPHHSAPVYY
ncbi:hypothetical protein PFISCL1PPCAC_10794 [Pristionchus fissidentatus]|uniref:Uncharacterized protein n=1 Tax=Pristionchus fissidentatus TaxID=1538716 RepID=A0AAV5VN82_9BILA|nr:hypothetical protein PFISCL1PPCAC_10794 [Pristionchus fissidentatus]